jgi:flagellar biosynthesis/type III secretory pathway M-ring protein FliF/YscJ
MTWLLKIKGWLEALGAVILAVLGAFVYGDLKGKSTGVKDAEQADQKATEKAVKNDLNTRQSIDQKVDSLPPPKVTVPAPTQPQEPSHENAQAIGSAQPGTAAAELQNWLSKD